MQFSTILSLLAVAGMTVAAPSVARRQSNNNVANGVANDVLEDGVTVDDTAKDINAPVGAGVLGSVNQVAPKGGLPPF
ncbi:protein ScwA [Aspergillus novofumigatus IBT 16806]|uniref:Uncharacterized protein n=1 Tax=Aspergillus novofumigatus (strain IBT 16806) TaxID=1392255 RepID=A0A2I1C5F9_ASPN1|nr:uncharacterized protein P174DRAFT_452125 [Aspergillus novofumigatus IBT 16806]PKX92846.1 hypothetical protein P174DRAFT_452125 [Aspergillus novofumigatus IBT 16806]